MSPEKVIDILMSYQVPHSTESEMQGAISKIFKKVGVSFKREHRLSKKDVVDFLVDGGVAIECKTQGQPLSIHRQLERYAKHDTVRSIILFTSVHMGMQESINSKPSYMIQCGISWL